ncbi:hypothetical protein B0H10DRAFT_977722 [Mycena sp. CBHHK59/15]|nr:hypothetical protein B0H10DRAFT_1093732 [Mycena sp. CBHHK59/15]KAJ6630217.1 hypothetical protein B0H10DRAFT_977722 [Mycena sp. CBHHK59/15]
MRGQLLLIAASAELVLVFPMHTAFFRCATMYGHPTLGHIALQMRVLLLNRSCRRRDRIAIGSMIQIDWETSKYLLDEIIHHRKKIVHSGRCVLPPLLGRVYIPKSDVRPCCGAQDMPRCLSTLDARTDGCPVKRKYTVNYDGLPQRISV